MVCNSPIKFSYVSQVTFPRFAPHREIFDRPLNVGRFERHPFFSVFSLKQTVTPCYAFSQITQTRCYLVIFLQQHFQSGSKAIGAG